MKKTILYIVLTFCVSCQNEIKKKNSVQYFDSEVFVDNEIKELLSKDLTAEKEISLNDKKEILKNIEVDSSFLYQEFKLLRDANINKPALLGKYKMDTFWYIDAVSLEDEMGLEYNLIDKSDNKLKMKKMSILSEDFNNVKHSIFVDLSAQNFMHSYSKSISYKVGNYISVSAWEKTLFQDTLFYESKIAFK